VEEGEAENVEQVEQSFQNTHGNKNLQTDGKVATSERDLVNGSNYNEEEANMTQPDPVLNSYFDNKGYKKSIAKKRKDGGADDTLERTGDNESTFSF